MKAIKKICLILSINLLLMVSLYGCQLANVDAEEVKTKDNLIGIYITREHLDLFDMETYFEDHADDFMSEKNIEVSNKYNGKVYATANITTEEENVETIAFDFDGIKGIAFFAPTIYPTDSTDSYRLFTSDPEITDRKFTAGNETTLEGTLYMDAALDFVSFYINPVYQTSEGQVYLMTGSGMSSSGAGGLSSTMNETTSETIDGVTKNTAFNVVIHIEPRNATEKVIIKQMNDSDEVVVTTTITMGMVPEFVSKDPKTTYIILEDYGYNLEGVIEIKREIIEKDEVSIACFFMGDDGIAVGEYITILEP